MTRMVGTAVRGIRAPIVREGDDLVEIVVSSVIEASKTEGFSLRDRDVIGITESYQESSYYTFSAFDLFCKVAALISYETNIEELGYEITELVKKNVLTPIIYPDSILCTVFHVDGYGNVFLNITIGEFMKWKENKKFVIEVESNKIVSISHSYDDVKVNDPLLTISSSGYLELAINRSNASELLGLKVGTPLAITIDPKESQK